MARNGVRVVVRVKGGVAASDSSPCCRIAVEGGRVFVAAERGARTGLRAYEADAALGPAASQEDVYRQVGEPALHAALEWRNSSLFAYGQTATGKTHSVRGSDDEPGLLPRLAEALVERVSAHNAATDAPTRLVVKASYVELYKERLADLLAPVSTAPGATPQNLRIRTHPNLGVHVDGAKETTIESVEDVLGLLSKGDARRKTAAHNLNEHSSRSHAVFTLRLVEELVVETRRVPCRWARIHVCDLAGSERQRETGCGGERLAEAGHINRGLLSLQRVIAALASRSGVPPIRESKLTHLLEEALGGTALCTLLACVSPADDAIPHSARTLAFAAEARTIVHSNEVAPNRELPEVGALRSEVAALRAQLSEAAEGASEEERRRVAELERALGAARQSEEYVERSLPLPARTAAKLRRAGRPEDANAVDRAAARVAEAFAALRAQARFVSAVEATLNAELRDVRTSDAKGLERLYVQLRAAASEGSRLHAARDAVVAAHGELHDVARQVAGRIETDVSKEEDDIASMEDETADGALSSTGSDAADDSPSHKALVAVRELAAFAQRGVASVRKTLAAEHEAGERVDSAALVALVEVLEDTAGGEVGVAFEVTEVAAMCSGLQGSAVLAWGDTRAVNLVEIASDAVGSALARRAEAQTQASIAEMRRLRQQAFLAEQRAQCAEAGEADALERADFEARDAAAARADAEAASTALELAEERADLAATCAADDRERSAAAQAAATEADIRAERAEARAAVAEARLEALEARALAAETRAAALEEAKAAAESRISQLEAAKAAADSRANSASAAVSVEAAAAVESGEAVATAAAAAAAAAARAEAEATKLSEAREALAEAKGESAALEARAQQAEEALSAEARRARDALAAAAVAEARADAAAKQRSAACVVM